MSTVQFEVPKPAAPASAAPAIDPELLLDPEKHGDALQATHTVAIALQQRAEELLDVMRGEMEPLLLELSKRLFDRRTTGGGLEEAINKYEAALSKMRMAQQSLRQMHEKTQTVGNHLLKG
jgi:hypothetical protein